MSERCTPSGPHSESRSTASSAGDDDVISPELGDAAHSSARKLLIFLAFAIPLFVLLQFSPLGERLRDWQAMQALMAGGGVEAGLIFVFVTAGLMALGTPRLLFYVLAGFVFDFWLGLLLALIGSMLGSFIAFRVARWAGRDWLLRRFGHRPVFARVMRTRPTVMAVCLVRCLPVSNAIINLALAVSTVKNRVFLLGTVLGFLPQGVIAVLIGAGVADDVAWEGAAQLSVALALVVAIMYFARRWRTARRTRT